MENKNVLIIGCGGLGGAVAEDLIRIGGCNLTLIDFDKFDESNLNRQRFCNKDSIGKYKAEEVAIQLNKIRSTKILFYKDLQFEDTATCRAAVRNASVVIDATDNIQTRRLISRICMEENAMLVSGAVNGWMGFQMNQRPGSSYVYDYFCGLDENTPQPESADAISMVCTNIASLMGMETYKYLNDKENEMRDDTLILNFMVNFIL